MQDPLSVQERIRAIFSDQLHIDLPADDADLLEGGLLDSLLFVSLLVQLEERFGVKVKLEHVDVGDFTSIARIADFVLAANGRRDG